MRLLVTETLDPDGAMQRWCSPDLRQLGHFVLPLPTQELAPLLGPDGLAAWLVAVTASFRPDLLILCPPYDHITRGTLDRLTSLGARPIAFAFDEPLFAAPRQAHPIQLAWLQAVGGYHHIFTTAPEAASTLTALNRPATWLRWAASPDAFSDRAPLPAPFSALLGRSLVLVGRPYPRRRALVARLAAAGIPLAIFGHGWGSTSSTSSTPSPDQPHIGPPLTGPQMHAVLASSRLVLTTGDWESTELPMVKYRLLEAAFIGAPQLVQHSPDLATYFAPDEIATYTDADSLIATARALLADPAATHAMASRARARALRDHTWAQRFTELSASLDLPSTSAASDPATPVPAAYLTGLALLAHAAERREATPLARAAFALWDELSPNPTALAGLARLALAADPPTAATYATAALDQLRKDPRPATGLYARLPTHFGTGLGQVGFLDPSPELEAIRLTSLLSEPLAPDALTAALAHIEALSHDPDRLVATAALLVTDDTPAAPAWRALFAAALAATPVGDNFSEHHPRWRAALAAENTGET